MRSSKNEQEQRKSDLQRVVPAALAANDDAYRLLFEHMDTMVCTLDLEGRFVSVNRAGEALTGYRADELVGKLAVGVIAPEFRDEAIRRFQTRLTSETDYAPDETMLVTRDGTRVPIAVTSSLMTRDGRPFGVLGLVHDISEKKSAEHALHQSEERFRSAFTSAAIGIALVALDGRFLEVNDSLCELLGYSEDELLAMTFFEITHPDDVDVATDLRRQLIAGEIRSFQVEKRYCHKVGHIVWIWLTVSLVRASDGTPLHFISQMQDISEHKLAREKIARSEARLAEAQLLAHLGSWERDLATDEVTWSRELYRIFDVDPDSGPLKYDRFLALVAPDDRDAVADVRRRADETGEPFEDEYRIVLPDGDVRWIHSRGAVVSVNGTPVSMVGTAQDVTEHKLAAERLREAESRFRSFFENAAVGQAICAPEGPWLAINPAFSALLGYSWDELQHLTWQDITHPDDLERDAELAQRLLAGDFPTYQLEKRYLHRDGGVVWALMTLTLVRDDKGKPLYSIAQVLDISARRRAEEAVARSEKSLAEAQQIARLGSWAWDVVADIVTWSDELYRIFGVDPVSGALTYARYLDSVHPDDRSLVEEIIGLAYEAGEPFSFEHRIVRPDGERRWVHSRGEVTMGADGPAFMQGTAQDITERKEAEVRLLEAEERYRTLVEQMPLAIYSRPLEMGASNLYVSPQVEQMLGYAAEEWLTNPDLLATIVHPDDRERVFADGERVRRTGEPNRAEYRYIAPDGSVIWVLDETYVVLDENGEPQCVQGYLLDITERKRTEDERDRLRDELHHAQKLEALGRLAGGVAHDFNNTLTAIKGYSELLLDGLEAGSSARREAEQIRRAADQASALPRQLLAFSRKQELQPGLLDLDGVVEAASGLLTQLVGEAISVQTIPGAEAARVLADASQVEQMLLNLVVNARDAMHGGGTMTIETRTEYVADDRAAEQEVTPGEFAVISVRDTGHGMDPETKARVFEPFFTTKGPGKGSGLGLATAYGTVRQSGGFIQVDSEVGSGSTFEIYLPCAGTGSDELEPQEGEPERPHVHDTVLLVEDEQLVRDVARTALERAGYRVLDAPCANDALSIWNDETIDVVVSDMVMPGMSGRELADRILHVSPVTPIVFMSGYTDEAPIVQLNGAAPPTFLSKPFSPATLVGAVQAALDQRSSRNGAGSDRHGAELTCLVADDHPAVLDSVSRFLELRGVDVVARVSRGDEALAEIARHRPAIALLDVGMTPLNGIEVARRAVLDAPDTRVVVYTAHRDRQVLERALDAGARGFVLKEAPLSELERALDVVAQGGTYVDPELASGLISAGADSELSPLTRREREVLALLADGQTNETASRTLGIAAETVQSHVRNIMGKLDADTRTQAVATAIRQSLID